MRKNTCRNTQTLAGRHAQIDKHTLTSIYTHKHIHSCSHKCVKAHTHTSPHTHREINTQPSIHPHTVLSVLSVLCVCVFRVQHYRFDSCGLARWRIRGADAYGASHRTRFCRCTTTQHYTTQHTPLNPPVYLFTESLMCVCLCIRRGRRMWSGPR